jgi:glycosyltransferase involved in cell wall biosynthesis
MVPRQFPADKAVIPTLSGRVPFTETVVPDISIIIPARNEELNIGGCLQSLVTQEGISFEIIVVDDGSIDQTGTIAKLFPGVRVIMAGPALEQRTGKNNALIAGVGEARADWILFTDADTVHLPGSLERALAEAKREKADLLSYSPEQVVVTLSERATMPVIFAELAAQFPPHKVREDSGVTAANGQYILVRRAAYEKAGGHGAVAGEILEDVALARAFRSAGFRVYFRYGGDAVRTRMYRSWAELREGWTKNLAKLFPSPVWLAVRSLLAWCGAWLAALIAVFAGVAGNWRWIGIISFWVLLYYRIAKANFALGNNLLAMAFGVPTFAYLLLRSKRAYGRGEVSWKGRTYGVRERAAASER